MILRITKCVKLPYCKKTWQHRTEMVTIAFGVFGHSITKYTKGETLLLNLLESLKKERALNV